GGVAQPTTDTTVAGVPDALDVLFVVNDSDADNRQSDLAAASAAFFSSSAAAGIDYHLAVINTDPVNGGMRGAPVYLTASSPNLQADFSQRLEAVENVDALEAGLSSSEAALSAPLVTGQNQGFLRPDARLAL